MSRLTRWRGRKQLRFIQSAIESGDGLVQRAQKQLEENAGRLIVAAETGHPPSETVADIVQKVRIAGPDSNGESRRAQKMHLEELAGRAGQPGDHA